MRPPQHLAALGLALVGLLAAPALAADMRPFENGSFQKIRQDRGDKPFIVSFWSADCTHCPKELQALGELKRRHPRLDIVLVSTDTAADPTVLAATTARHGLGDAEQWVFATDQPERLRYEVDRRWWGELPRTYFFDGNAVEAVSGLVPADRLARWALRGSGGTTSPPR